MSSVNVVIQTAFIGDLFLAIPLLTRIRKQYPQHQIILVCKKGLGEFFLKFNIVDHTFEIEKGQSRSYNDIVKKINTFDVENVFCLHQSFRSALFSFKIKAKNKISFASSAFSRIYKKLIFNSVLLYPRHWPDVIRQMAILSPVDSELAQFIRTRDWSYLNVKNKQDGFEPIPAYFSFPRLMPLEKSKGAKRIALFPGSVWATKKWTHQGYADVAQKLMNHGNHVVIMGGPDDIQDAAAIQKYVPQIENQTGQMSLLNSSLYMQNFDLIICNDSAPAHIAASLQRPVLSLFGPTVLDFGFRPWDDLSQVIENDQLSCRPCGPHGHHQCPLGHHDCMKKIDSNRVFKKALEMLEGI